jgi:hypothetical protein
LAQLTYCDLTRPKNFEPLGLLNYSLFQAVRIKGEQGHCLYVGAMPPLPPYLTRMKTAVIAEEIADLQQFSDEQTASIFLKAAQSETSRKTAPAQSSAKRCSC